MVNKAVNPWRYWLEDFPRVAYQAAIPQTGSRTFLDWWQRNYPQVEQQYAGVLGRQALAGQPPSLNFSDYLSGFNWQQEFQALSPGERGEQPGRFAPRMRWSL